jgi:hypothetical protein
MIDDCCVVFGFAQEARLFKILYVFDFAPEFMPEVYEWISEHGLTLASLSVDPLGSPDSCMVARFASPEEALLFRMRWL